MLTPEKLCVECNLSLELLADRRQLRGRGRRGRAKNIGVTGHALEESRELGVSVFGGR